MRRLIAALTGLASSAILTLALSSCAHAQLANVPNWIYQTPLNDTCAVGFMDSSSVIDMTNHRNLTLRVCVDPPGGGAAEPWAIVGVQAIGSVTATCDSNSTGIMQLQSVADHSYSSAVAGDSLAYGTWSQGNAVTPGNGVVLCRGQRPNTKWAYPHAYFFELGNKGQSPRVRYVYFRVFTLASSGGSPRIKLTTEKSN